MADVLSISPPAANPSEHASRASDATSRRELLLAWLAGNPVVTPAVGLTLGIMLDAAWAMPAWLVVLLAVPALASLWLGRRQALSAHACVFTLAFLAGAARHDVAYRCWPADHIVRYTDDVPTPATLIGSVVSPPTLRQRQTGPLRWFPEPMNSDFLLAVEAIEGRTARIPVSGIVRVKVSEPVLDVGPGQRVRIGGTLYRTAMQDVRDGRDWGLVNRRRGILVGLTCDHAANVQPLATGPTRQSLPARILAAARLRARLAMLERAAPGDMPGEQLLEALVLGQRSAVDPALNQAFVETGTVHYLSVSGAHVGMLASAVWLACMLAGISRRSGALVTMILVTAYATLAEPNPPVIRSAIMGVLLCTAILLRRPVRTANWLALSAVVILVVSPVQLFEPGFQLSFLTLIGLIYLGPQVHRGLRDLVQWLRGADDPLLKPPVQRLLRPTPLRRLGWWTEDRLTAILGASIAAWLASLPLAAYHFQQVAIWGWLNSILLIVPVWLTLVIGLLKTVLTLLAPPVGHVLGVVLPWVTEWTIASVECLRTLPGSSLPPVHVSGAGAAAALGMLAYWMLRPFVRVRLRWLLPMTAAAIIVCVVRLAPPLSRDGLRVRILDVGSANTTLIELPDGRTLLYDMGARPPYDVYRWTLAPILARENIYRIDTLLVSHPDLDHFSGIPALLERHSVGRIVTSGHFDRLPAAGSPADRFIQHVRDRGLAWSRLHRGQCLADTGDVIIECLWPPSPEQMTLTATNETSLVLRVTFDGRRILFCGDIQDAAQRELLRTADLRADVLLLPHHGGVTTFTRSFVQAVDPAVCIRASGQRDADTRNGLLNIVRGRQYLSTAECGDIDVRVRKGRLEVSGSREGPLP